MHKKIGYSFETSLICCINQYVNIQKEYNAKYFYYKDIDFEFAFERYAYYAIMDSNYYLNQIANNESIVKCQNLTEMSILALMYPDKKFKIETNNFRYFAKRFFKACVLNVFFRKRLLRYNNKDSYRYVFVIIKLKFIKYLEMLYINLSNAIFLIIDDFDNCAQYCIEKQYKYIMYKEYEGYILTNNADMYVLINKYASLSYFLEQFNFEKYIIPEGDAFVFEILNLYCINNNKKTICIQHGWNPLYHNGFRNMHFDKFLSWGAWFSQSLRTYNKKQSFIDVGSHILATPVEIESTQYIAFFLQAVTPLISQDDFNALLELIIGIANEFPDKQFIVREHPGYMLSVIQKRTFQNVKNIKFMNSDRFLLHEVLSISSVVISIFSTVLVEALAYNCLPFIINTTGMKHYEPNLASLNLAIEVKDFISARKQLRLLLSSNIYDFRDNIRKSKHLFFTNTSEIAKKNILKEIDC